MSGGGVAVAERGGRIRFTVRVQPRASRTEIVGAHGDALKVRLSSPPVDGAANEELVAMLAKALGVGRGAIAIVTGTSARSKVVEVEGVDAERVRRLAKTATRGK